MFSRRPTPVRHIFTSLADIKRSHLSTFIISNRAFLSLYFPFHFHYVASPSAGLGSVAEEEEQLLEEEAAEAVVGIMEEEEWDHCDMEKTAQEDPALLDEWPDWDPKTHAIDWDLDHGYAQTPYGEKRPHPHCIPARAPRRLTINEAWDEWYIVSRRPSASASSSRPPLGRCLHMIETS